MFVRPHKIPVLINQVIMGKSKTTGFFKSCAFLKISSRSYFGRLKKFTLLAKGIENSELQLIVIFWLSDLLTSLSKLDSAFAEPTQKFCWSTNTSVRGIQGFLIFVRWISPLKNLKFLSQFSASSDFFAPCFKERPQIYSTVGKAKLEKCSCTCNFKEWPKNLSPPASGNITRQGHKTLAFL